MELFINVDVPYILPPPTRRGNGRGVWVILPDKCRDVACHVWANDYAPQRSDVARHVPTFADVSPGYGTHTFADEIFRILY
ncbi:MAG: hypothetical protein HDR84_02600 [Bacteroides sp.]|nr:hypothetical protein [Bacteroides sp.]